MSGRVFGQYVLLASTWGASFLFIKVGLEGASPAQVVLGRLVAGALVLVGACAVTRSPLPRQPVTWLHLLEVALLLCVAPFPLFASAELASSGCLLPTSMWTFLWFSASSLNSMRIWRTFR